MFTQRSSCIHIPQVEKLDTSEKSVEYERLAVRMRKQSTEIKISSSEILTYKLPVKQTMLNDKRGVAKYMLGEPMPGCATTERVLMVVGAAGAGKSKLINGMINYIFGIDWKDDFRLMLVTENTSQISQAYSKTLITAYTIYPMHGSILQFPLTIVDTPGFGDIEGLEHDKMIIQQIQDFFSIKDSNGIDHLDGIGFVVQASLTRKTPILNYIFLSILSIFGNDVVSNLFIMVTCADSQDPPVMAAIREANIDYKAYFKFNNSVLFASNKQSVGDDNENLNRMFWKMGYISFKNFFSEFSLGQSVSLYSTKEVLRECRQLELTVQSIQLQIDNGTAKLEEIRQEELVLQQQESIIAANKDYTYTITVTKQRKKVLPPGKYVMTCLVCNFTCHSDCDIADDRKKYQCSAMDFSLMSIKKIRDVKCRICPKRCFWQEHIIQSCCYELYEETEVKTSADLQEKYTTALHRKKETESILNQLNASVLVVEDDIKSKVNEIQRCLQRLDKIALKQSPLTQVQLLNVLIEAEKQECKPKYQARINMYEMAKQKARIIEKAKNNPEELGILTKQRK